MSGPDPIQGECPDCRGKGEVIDAAPWETCLECDGTRHKPRADTSPVASGDFIGDDLSEVHTCHAGCPCQSPPAPDTGQVTVDRADLEAMLDAGLPFGSRTYLPLVQACDRLRAALEQADGEQ